MRPLSLHIAPVFALLMAAACNNGVKDDTDPDDTDVTTETDDVPTDDTETDTDVDETDPPDTDPDTDDTDTHTDDTGETILTLADVGVGDLIITEISFLPDACAAPNGQFVELYYAGSEQLDLNGLVLSNSAGTVSLSSTVVVQPGEYILLVRSSLSANCYGLVGDWTYGTLTLNVAGDLVRIASNTTVFDEVDFTGSAWADLRAEGRTLQHSGIPNAASNDDPDSWCLASPFFPMGATSDAGTPRAQAECGNSSVEVPGDLLLTEIMDFADNGAIRYVEVYNPGVDPMPLDGWEILVFVDGTTPPVIVPLDTDATLQPDKVWTIASSLSSYPMYVQAGIPLTCGPDQFDARINGNGNDAIVLAYRGTPVDVFGQPLVNGTGTAWEYTDRVAVRDDAVRTPRTTYDAAEWTITQDFQQSSICRFDEPYVPPEEETDRDTFVDTYEFFETDTFYTGPIDTGDPVVFESLNVLSPGDIVINEVMANPSCGSDSEYVEITLNANKFIDLNGLTLQVGSASFVYTGNLRMLPFTQVLLYRHPVGDTDGNCYFGDISDQAIAYSGATFDIPQVGATIRVRNAGTVFDEVVTNNLRYNRGIAWQLDPGVYDEDTNTPTPATANNDASAWCVAADAIPGSTDLGSPGASNYCGAPLDTGDTDNGGGTDGGDTDDTDVIPPRTVDTLAVGDLIITELMIDPAVPCDDANGEYIEVYNTTLDVVDLAGLVVEVDGTPSTVGTLLLPSGGLAILYRTPAPTFNFCHNIGLARRATYDAALELVNAGGSISIGNGTITLDEVDFSVWAPGAQSGAAWSLDSGAVSPSANDSQANWCQSGVSVGSQNIGTPNGVFSCPTP